MSLAFFATAWRKIASTNWTIGMSSLVFWMSRWMMSICDIFCSGIRPRKLSTSLLSGSSNDLPSLAGGDIGGGVQAGDRGGAAPVGGCAPPEGTDRFFQLGVADGVG